MYASHVSDAARDDNDDDMVLDTGAPDRRDGSADTDGVAPEEEAVGQEHVAIDNGFFVRELADIVHMAVDDDVVWPARVRDMS